jgi:hypothetical protein
MPTTSNFGWTTPADTDLVKDGAAAIRTLGNGIDTSFLDLKGGTTGQILSKASNTDLDYTWIANDQGDITEVQAGTGISVASGTGPIPVVTNTVATTFDAKGDLVAGTGADTFAKLTVGANDTVLTADSATATGLKWATVVSGDWTFGTWSPTYAGLTVGNGTVTARYAQKGKLVVAWWKFVLGNTSSITGGITVSTPVNPNADGAYTTIVEAQAGNVNYIMATNALSNRWYLRAIDSSATYAKTAVTSSTVPGTWTSASGDYINFTAVYEAA